MNENSQTNQSFYDRISGAYDMIADAGEHKARETGERLLNVQEGEHVLELGFGTGNSILNLAEFAGSTGRIYGVDISPGMLDVASKKVEAKDLADRVELQVADGRALPYADDTFDAVFASFTLELFALEDIPRVLAEVRRVLKPGGRVGVVSMARVKAGEQESLLEKTYVWMHQHFPHIVDCQPIDVEGEFQEAGFALEADERLEIFTMPVAAVIAR